MRQAFNAPSPSSSVAGDNTGQKYLPPPVGGISPLAGAGVGPYGNVDLAGQVAGAVGANVQGPLAAVLNGIKTLSGQISGIANQVHQFQCLHIRDPRIAALDNPSTAFPQRQNLNPAG